MKVVLFSLAAIMMAPVSLFAINPHILCANKSLEEASKITRDIVKEQGIVDVVYGYSIRLLESKNAKDSKRSFVHEYELTSFTSDTQFSKLTFDVRGTSLPACALEERK